jgi:DNA-binding CsgD family transcriptional regulator
VTPEGCPLTPAELRVVALLMQGLSYEQIAARLGRKTSTIRSQLNSAYRHLGVRTSYQAVLECVRAGWLVWSDADPETAVLLRIEGLLRDLVEAVEAGLERQSLSGAQQDYLDRLEDYLRARDDPGRSASLAGMDQALRSMLHGEPAPGDEPGHAPPDPVADLGSVIAAIRSATP